MKKTEQKNYAFIDSQNLNLAIRDLGWHLDSHRFRPYLRFMNDLQGLLAYKKEKSL